MNKTWRAGLATIPLLLTHISIAGCTMKSYYFKDAVQPVTAKVSGDTLRIRYRVPPESMMYSKGVNYVIETGQIKVVIDRCSIREKCEPMAASTIPLDLNWQAEVQIPYHGEKIIMIYSDAEEQIYPVTEPKE